jgi:sulfur-carrier protein
LKIQVKYFASVREQLGAGETVDLVEVKAHATANTSAAPPGPTTVGELRAWLALRSPAHAAVLDASRGLRAAFNQTLCTPDQALADGAEVAFFPPVTGG